MNQQQNIAKETKSHWTRVNEGSIDQINRTKLAPDTKTKLKCHWDRTKHVYIVKGRGWVKLPKTNLFLSQGDSIDIELGESHQFENAGAGSFEFIEIERMHLPDETDLDALEQSFHECVA